MPRLEKVVIVDVFSDNYLISNDLSNGLLVPDSQRDQKWPLHVIVPDRLRLGTLAQGLGHDVSCTTF